VGVHWDDNDTLELRWGDMEAEMSLLFHTQRAQHAQAWKPGELLLKRNGLHAL